MNPLPPLIVLSGIFGWELGPLSGSELGFSFVKTDSNWLLRMLALLRLSLFKKPSSFFKSDSPVVSLPAGFM